MFANNMNAECNFFVSNFPIKTHGTLKSFKKVSDSSFPCRIVIYSDFVEKTAGHLSTNRVLAVCQLSLVTGITEDIHSQ